MRSVRVVFLLFLFTRLLAAEGPRGHLLLIGGGEQPREAMEKFVELAGGPSALILLIPTASEDPDYIAALMKSLRTNFGVRNLKLLNVREPADALRQDYVELVGHAGGVFFSGGDQRRIIRALARSPLLTALRQAYQRGAALAGTSAGTACMGSLMITGEGNFDVVQKDAVELWPGLGFFPGVILDQHFIARRRFNRLLSATLANPQFLAIGVDENTAVWLKPDETFQVIGSSSVLVLDASSSSVTHRQMGNASLFSAGNLRLHVLAPGDSFNLPSRQPMAAEALEP